MERDGEGDGKEWEDDQREAEGDRLGVERCGKRGEVDMEGKDEDTAREEGGGGV